MHRVPRRRFLQASGAVAVTGLAGCIGTNDGYSPQNGPGTAVSTTDFGMTTSSQGDTFDKSPPVADRKLPTQYSFRKLRTETRSGGPPKDGIPSIDDPTFVSSERADEMLDPGDIVFGYASKNDVKAYPQHVLVHHEIVNDALDGTNVSVTYCPLTGTVLGFERGGTEFGVSGKLVNNNLVMYDRNTDSRWPQILATAIEGPLEGRSLREFRLVWTTWKRWKGEYPATRVLSEDTGFARNYDRGPYGNYNPPRGYYARQGTLFPPLRKDDRFPDKRVVMGVRTPTGAVAFLKESVRKKGVVEGDLDEEAFTAIYDERFDTAFVYRNPAGKSISLDGTTATFDSESHSPDSLPLERVHTFDAMWFAWVGFYPGTKVFR